MGQVISKQTNILFPLVRCACYNIGGTVLFGSKALLMLLFRVL